LVISGYVDTVEPYYDKGTHHVTVGVRGKSANAKRSVSQLVNRSATADFRAIKLLLDIDSRRRARHPALRAGGMGRVARAQSIGADGRAFGVKRACEGGAEDARLIPLKTYDSGNQFAQDSKVTRLHNFASETSQPSLVNLKC
jgi:hypothetical protein